MADLTHFDLPWELDCAAQSFVDEHPDGGSLYEIAEVFGVSFETIRRVEYRALRRLAAALGADVDCVQSARDRGRAWTL